MIRFSCPKCQMVLQAASEQAGAKVSCPKCKFQMQVPSVPPVAKVAPQPAVPTPDWLGDMRAEQRADQRPPAPTPTAVEAAPWYFTREGKRYGPYTTAQLKQFAGSGQLLPTELVWKEGVEGWKPASAVEGLFIAQQSSSQAATTPKPLASPDNPFDFLAAPSASPLSKGKRQWHRLSPKAKLGIISGAVAVPLLLILVIALMVGGKSRQQGGAVAQKDGDKKGNKVTGNPRSGSLAERAMQAKGLKERPAHLKPQKPGSTDDFLDALDILGFEPANAMSDPPGIKGWFPPSGTYKYVPLRKQSFVDEDKWIELFGKPEKLTDGYSTGVGGKVFYFQRWKYVLTDGPVTVHGQHIPQGKKFVPRAVGLY